MYSVIAPAHQPLFLQRIKNAAINAGRKRILSGKAELDVPRIFLPVVFFPPLPGQTPRARGPNNFSGIPLPADFYRPAFFTSDVSRQRRPKIPETDLRFYLLRSSRRCNDASPARIGKHRHAKFLHTKSVWTKRVEHLRRSNIVFTDHACDAGERELQLVGIGRNRKKQPALHSERPVRIS